MNISPSRNTQNIPLDEYMSLVEPTDKFKIDELQPTLMGLYGEVGSVLSNYKKRCREKEAFVGYREADMEEFGDVIWYLTAICRRFNLKIGAIFSEALSNSDHSTLLAAGDNPLWPIAKLSKLSDQPNLDVALLTLGETAASFLKVKQTDPAPKDLLINFSLNYITALQAAKIPFNEVLSYNVRKTRGRFVKPILQEVPMFDSDYEKEEKIPDNFEITITKRKSGKAYLQWRGVFIGDPLTDNIKDMDGYRFHDVFHFAHAAILHWSPVFRALIKHKRKSNSQVDEEQDSGRALVVEEGLTAWIFSQAKKEFNFFENSDIGIPFDMLKTIQQFVSGYEVDRCPLYLWEQAILQGYEVFRKVRENDGGIIVCDKINRQIRYRPAEGNQ